jgi:hypothetical protein
LSTYGDKVYIKEGIKAGDKVIVSDVVQIYDELNN